MDRQQIQDAKDDLEDKLTRSVVHLSRPLPFTVVCDSSDRASWLKARRATIGASESAIVLGISPWGSPLSLWAEKTGAMTREEPDVEPEWTFWGSVLEEAIVRGYAKRTGRATVPFGLLLRSTRWPWMSATPDALVTDDLCAAKRAAELNRVIDALRDALAREQRQRIAALMKDLRAACIGWWPLQIKNVGFQSAEHWAEGVPPYYQAQCIHEALVFGADKTTAAALIAGQKLAWDDVAADPNDILTRRIVNMTERFMREHVEARVEPPADGSDASRAALAALYPREEPEKTITLGPDLMEMAERADQLKSEQKTSAKEVATIENRIRQAMGDAERCVFADSSGYSYKADSRGVRKLLRKPYKGER